MRSRVWEATLTQLATSAPDSLLREAIFHKSEIPTKASDKVRGITGDYCNPKDTTELESIDSTMGAIVSACLFAVAVCWGYSSQVRWIMEWGITATQMDTLDWRVLIQQFVPLWPYFGWWLCLVTGIFTGDQLSGGLCKYRATRKSILVIHRLGGHINADGNQCSKLIDTGSLCVTSQRFLKGVRQGAMNQGTRGYCSPEEPTGLYNVHSVTWAIVSVFLVGGAGWPLGYSQETEF